MSKAVVVDTNVLLVAEGLSDFSRLCEAKCGNILRVVQRDRILVLDRGREILTEYGRKLSERKGQRGMGYEFWKWLVNTTASHSRCEMVNLTSHPDRGYEEFPDHAGLLEFDKSDRMFVAVAAVHPAKPEIIQATDSKWWGWKDALEECGIRLNLPCEAELKAKWEAKIGKHRHA
jgi:hypothetical protein